MQIIHDTDFQLNSDSAVTIGKFDGIHRGHRLLLDAITDKKREGLKAVVFTFDISPLEFFSGKRVPSLTTGEEKRRIFEYLGIDTLIEYPLTKVSAAIPPKDYITKILCKQMRMKYIAAGSDISFGDKGSGDAGLLEEMQENIYTADIYGKLRIDGEEVSSTLIRDVISKGDMQKARKLIGVPYALSGTVMHGRKIGRSIGFPTVNIEVSDDKLIPPFGVYFTEVSSGGKHYNAVTNIGTKPTVADSQKAYCETNIFNFDKDIYGQKITVKLLKFVRAEKKFSDVSKLKKQISADIIAGKEFFNEI